METLTNIKCCQLKAYLLKSTKFAIKMKTWMKVAEKGSYIISRYIPEEKKLSESLDC
jgi:hypothetical protein